MPKTRQLTLLAHIASKRDLAVQVFKKKYPAAHKFFTDKQIPLADIRKHSAKLLTGATLGGALLLSSPKITEMIKPGFSQERHMFSLTEVENIFKNLPAQIPRPLDTETNIENAINDVYGLRAAFELDGNRIPFYHGGMGLEQHLYRFSGDTLAGHQYPEEGFAPLLGAFDYFARPGVTRTQWEKEEQYYIVLQTFLIPTWNQDWARLKPWYAFRKFVVFNPENGKGVVAVLGDSGPAVWTGKVFGGSPEVMADLGFYPKYTRGDVVVLFLDDPENKVPLGPLEVKYREVET